MSAEVSIAAVGVGAIEEARIVCGLASSMLKELGGQCIVEFFQLGGFLSASGVESPAGICLREVLRSWVLDSRESGPGGDGECESFLSATESGGDAAWS